ncbi:MAG: hypothetical protein DRQ78_10560 [Epsilonproteobacteria bacterium]|nr:MAG: hypothetical protein DRQ78_10560 [Campylobacterota bacterium]
MKSFTKFITEANYMRFLKKNKNLTDDQRNDINDFFSKESPQAGSAFEWQDRKVRKMDFSDFESYMRKTPAGSRKLLKKIKIPGSKGEDYWPMRIKNKLFIANIPLNRSTATYMNSCKYGNLLVNYCVGWNDDSQYWNKHVVKEQKVPVYVIDGRKKWVVMIKEGNRKYEVWDKMNNEDVSIGNPEPIPGFSIKKELIGSKQSKLYDEIRLDFYSDKDTEDDHGDDEEEPDFSDAQDDYDKFLDEMDKAQEEREDNEKELDKEMEEIRQKTLIEYGKKRDKWEPRYNELDEAITDIYEFLESDEETFEYKGVHYTKDSISRTYKELNKEFDIVSEKYETLDSEYDEIDNMEVWDMYSNSDEYEWEGEVYNEDTRNEFIDNYAYPELQWYSDYMEYAETYLNMDLDDGDDKSKLSQAIWEYIYEPGRNETAQDKMESIGITRP